MRTLLEKAIVHLLNGEDEKAEKLFHQFMVGRARQIHESLRTGHDDILNENWDSEITSEEYFNEDDLKSAEDELGDEMGADDTDVGAEGDDVMPGAEAGMGDDDSMDDAGMGDDMGDDTMDDAGMGDEMDAGEGDVASRLDNVEDQLADIQAEFDRIMGELDMGDDSEAADAVDGGDEGDDEGTDFDFGGEETADDEGEAEGDAAENAEDAAEAGDLEDDMSEEGDEKKVDEDMDFEDIAESILADLDRVNVDMTDGKEVGAGKTIAKNDKSPALQRGVNDRKGAAPVHQKASNHTGFEREPAPEAKKMKPRRNNVASTDAALKSASTQVGGAELSKKAPEGPQKSPVNANSGGNGN